MKRRLLLILLSISLLYCITTPTSAQLYKYREDSGITIITNNIEKIPQQYKDFVTVIKDNPTSKGANKQDPNKQDAAPPQITQNSTLPQGAALQGNTALPQDAAQPQITQNTALPQDAAPPQITQSAALQQNPVSQQDTALQGISALQEKPQPSNPSSTNNSTDTLSDSMKGLYNNLNNGSTKSRAIHELPLQTPTTKDLNKTIYLIGFSLIGSIISIFVVRLLIPRQPWRTITTIVVILIINIISISSYLGPAFQKNLK